MKIICYRAKRGTVWDRLIGWIERSAVSHVEMVEHESDDYWYVIGCHIQRGGVSRARIMKSDDWIELSMDLPAGQEEVAKHIAARLLGTPYAMHKLPRTRLDWWPTFGKGLICTSFISTCLELPEPDSWGIADVLDLALDSNLTKPIG